MTLHLNHIVVDDRKLHTCVFSCFRLTMTGTTLTDMIIQKDAWDTHYCCYTPLVGHSILSSRPTYDGLGTWVYWVEKENR